MTTMIAEVYEALKDAGASDEKAKAAAEALAEYRELKTVIPTLATKADLEALKLATKADIEALRLATKADLDALKLATKADLEVLRLGTKADLDALRLGTKADLERLESRLEAKIADSVASLLKWLVGILFLQAGLIVTLVKLL